MRSILLLFSIVAFAVQGQKNVFLKISPKVNGADLVLGTNYTDFQGVDFNLDHFNYYLSGLRITHDGGQLLDMSQEVYLVKPDAHDLYLGFLDVTSIESVQFNIGVPANLNTASGPDAIDISLYPSDHPLSFQEPSMYWGWSAGYMFLVSGGYADSNADGIADAYFELHNLGGHNYTETPVIPIVQTNVGNDQIDVYMDCNIEQWLKSVPIETIGIMHGSLSYNESSMYNVTTEPVFTQPVNAGTTHLNSLNSEIYYSTGMVYWKNMPAEGFVVLCDMTGKELLHKAIGEEDGSLNLGDIPSGIYLFQVFDASERTVKAIKLFH
jgi:hypothetical protein